MSNDDATGLSSLERLFRPRSIALVGATDKSVWSISAFDNLSRCGFDGAVHLINPKGGNIHGTAAATSCAAVGQRIDAALLMVPEASLLDTFEDLRQAEVAGAVVLAAGFAETGESGARRQEQMAEMAKTAGIRLIGPNCQGFANFSAKTVIWTTPLRRPMPGASIAIASQSGALAGQLEQFAYQLRIAPTHMVSTGNEADVTIADVILYLAHQPEPRAIAVFLETIRDPAGFIAAAEAARRAGKQIVVLKVGASQAAAKAAQAHTGSLVGDDSIFNALCKKLGIVRVKSLEELIVTTDLFARLKPVTRGGLALVAMSGGLCEIALDESDELGLRLASLTEETKFALRKLLPPHASAGNPLDITGAAMLKPELIEQSIETIARDPAVGLVGYVFDIPVHEDKRGVARTFIKHVGAGFGKIEQSTIMMSHAFSTLSGESRSLAEEYGVDYTGAGVNLTLRALAHLFEQRATHNAIAAVALTRSTARPQSERAVLAYLAEHGVGVVPGEIVTSAADAVAAARNLGGPVVLKVCSADIQHKSDVGGVALNLNGDAAVHAAYESLIARVSAALPTAKLDGVIVSPMRTGGIELFAGTLRDPQWGPAIAVGLGGIWIETLKDTSVRLLPVSEQDVLEMLAELRGGALLDGLRGVPRVDRHAIARAVVAIGNAALALGSSLAALEVNPLLASPQGIEALDGLTVWE